jgi:hypothetical protein
MFLVLLGGGRASRANPFLSSGSHYFCLPKARKVSCCPPPPTSADTTPSVIAEDRPTKGMVELCEVHQMQVAYNPKGCVMSGKSQNKIEVAILNTWSSGLHLTGTK